LIAVLIYEFKASIYVYKTLKFIFSAT